MLPRKWNINYALIGLVICCCITSEIVAAADFQCYQCVGEDCDDPDVKLCNTQTETDQCYVRLDSDADIIGMGCASELGDETEIIKLIKSKELYVCSTAICNGFENLPESNQCTKCDSLTDEKCAIQPKTAGTKSRCGAVPYTQCYERVNLKKGGTTERGCLYDLASEDFYSCVSGEDNNCNICVGNSCNTEVVPANRPQCQRCDSQADRSCSSSTPSALSVCPVYIENEACVSHYNEEGVTLRGCASELSCNTTSKNCQICKSNGCNIADMAKRSEKELYGIFQDLPLNCNTCEGAQCQDGWLNLRKCEGNIHQDCLSVFDTEGVLVARGCEDALDTAYLTHCDKNPELCFNCKSNGCNNYEEVPATQDCIYCDTESNGNCLNNLLALQETRTCVEGCVTALYESKSRSGVYELARTCFEDLEFDDRESCANGTNGTNENCVRCTDEECNTDLLPAEGRLSCLYCDGDDCDEPVSRPCDVYWPADQCYIYFDDVTHSAVAMGCKSSLPTDAIISDPLHYYVCDGDDCNTYTNLPEAHFCYVCNSVDDVNCAANPSLVENAVRCQINPHTDCYKRITDDGHTERGCISSLNTTEFLNCHQGTPGQYCSICTENYCNRGLYPSYRLSCYRCNSADDPSCESEPSAGSTCPLFDEDDYCVSKWVDGIIYRGCATELRCDANSTTKTCNNCSFNYCNSVALEGEYPIGNPGQFQDLPLNCYQCDSAEDCAESLGVVRKCDGDIYQTCTTVFSKTNASVIGRGCSDKYAQTCDNDATTNCYNCKSNGCNVAQEESDYINCIFCDGQTDENCLERLADVKSTRKCYKNCVSTLYNRTNVGDDGDDVTPPVRELIRTCLDDLELDEREACAAGKDENCKVCSTNKCNTAVVGTHLSCYQCVGDECQLPQKRVCHAVSEDDQCFARYDEHHDSIVELGCKSNYDADVVKELIIAKLFWLCEGENCNTIDAAPAAQTCSICSSLTDEDCAIAPSTVNSSTSCGKLPYTQCYTRILESGHTERGCLSSIEGEDFYDCVVGSNTTKCLACEGKSCNAELFPANRRSCHQCNSLVDPSCESTPDAGAVCLLYSTDESCTVKLQNDVTYRGCSYELSCDGTPDRQSCRQCTDKDNCNTADLASTNIGEPGKWQGLPLNCYDCEGSECATSNGVLRKCQLNNLQICQTIFGTDDQVVRRGCSDDVAATHETYCEENPTKCLGCKSSGCNNASSLDQYIDCFACDSALSSNCALNFDGKDGVKTRKCQSYCAVALYPRSSAPNSAYELERTCLDDMDLDEREECLAGENKLCKACMTGLCNNETIPENRHKCYHCVDEDCEDYEVAECRAYKENDQCYISFDDENSVLGMGCRSEFEDDVVVDLIKSKKFVFCEGEECNGPETIATPKTCTVCDSKTEPQCATNPNLVTDTKRCTALPYTDCYTRVKEDGHTARGCISDLPANNFYDCLTGNDTLCAACTGDKCNSLDVFPANRWTCHQCDSETNALCATEPNSVKVCPIYSAADSCVTTYYEGVTTRGCASSLQCPDNGDNSTCRSCDNEPGCNTVNLDRIFSQGKPGRWQDVPLTCGHCEGEENCEGVGIYRVCTGNLEQSCMTVFNESGEVIQRGCSDALEETHYDLCEAKPDYCMRCNSNGCNDATKLTDYIDCLSCDTDSNGNCVDRTSELTKTRKCNKYCMTALYAKYEEPNPAYGLSRSCFDDMDLDERDACAAGENDYCKVCDTPKCNTQLIPQLRLSCNHCDGADCLEPQPATCANYRPDDQCYIKFDESSAVTGMGCRSEFSHADAEYLLSQKRLFFCGGDNCNTYDAIPETQSCMLCSSRTDPDCAISPGELTAATQCAKAPYTECYTRVLPSGVTERGCLSSLEDDEFLGCLNGTSQSCVSCAGSYCNQELFPEDRHSCHICDSDKDRKCAYKPNSVSLCPLYAQNDTCVTAYINDVTYRGCSSSLKCEGSPTSKTCETCVGEACNTVNLERQQDDNHGKWQDLPLTCLTCSGDDCSSAQLESLTCENNNEQDCMTVFQDNKVVRRGCSDAVELEFEELCEDDWSMCPSCKSNECNNANSLSEYNQCFYCDTHKQESCLGDPWTTPFKTRPCQGACMTVLYPSDGSPNPVYEFMRTCLNDKEVEDQQKCSAGTDPYCQSCTGWNCNEFQLPKDRHSCYQCVGEDCEEPVLKICPLYKSNDQCFTTFDDSNSIVQMGCTSSFRNQQVETIIGTKRIHVCEGVGCNTLDSLPIPHKCAVCDSNDDYACATNAAEVGSSVTCSQYPYTDCYTKLVSSDGSTTRGCLSDLPTADFVNCVLGNDTNCSICVGDGCNREVFPVDRQQCYTCSSIDDPECESNPTRLLPCPYISEMEKCRTAYGGGVTVRGCSSEVFCDVSDRSTCRSCNGTACNTIDLAHREENDGNHGKWQDLPLTCLTCSGDDCSSAQLESLKCEKNNEQDCMTVFQDNKVVRRGCSDVVELEFEEYCENDWSMCPSCKSNECNNANSLSEYNQCIYCDTHKNESCLWEPTSAWHKTRPCQGACMTVLYPSDGSPNPVYELMRTCLNDKEVEDQQKCSAGTDSMCQSCTGAKCNDVQLPKDRHSCYQCVGEECEEPALKTCPLYKSNDQCFTTFDDSNSIVQMGCTSSFRNQQVETIIGTKRIHVCDGVGCNTLDSLPIPHKCAVCDSNEDYTCATNAAEVGSFSTCSQYPYTDCYTKLVSSDGSTTRGCLSDLPTSDFINCVLGNDTNCSICVGDGCNREIFPVDRQQCYTCSSDDDPECESNPTRLLPCPYVSEAEKCRTAYSGNVTVRGCSSEVYCDNNDRKTCRSCNGFACNSIDLAHREEDDGNHGMWQELPLRCHTCVGEDCLYSLGPAYNCSSDNVAQDCATVFTTSGEIKRRGCADDVEDYEQRYCRENPQLCFTCKSNECNDAWNITEYVQCNYCTSETDESCATDPQYGLFAKRACKQECMVAMRNTHIIRSCLDDKEENQRYVCRDDVGGTECSSCNTDNCNNYAYPPDRLSCHVCSDASCRSTVSKTCPQYVTDDFCFAKYENGNVELMGCGSSQSSNDLAKWETERKLYKCSGSDCNDLPKLPSKGAECLSCNSATALACAQNPFGYGEVETCPPLQDECVTYVDAAGHTLRGCLSQLTQSEQSSCQASGKCAICTGDKCNNEIFPRNRLSCHTCNSQSDSACIKTPNSLQICPLYDANDRCVTKRSDDYSYIERGCQTELTCPNTNDDSLCIICEGNGCNTAELTAAAVMATAASLLTILVVAMSTVLGHRYT